MTSVMTACRDTWLGIHTGWAKLLVAAVTSKKKKKERKHRALICFKRGKLPPLCLQGTVTCHHDENVQSRSSENYPHTLLKSRRQDNHFFSVSLSECLTRRWKAHHCVWPQNPFIRETTLKSSDFTLFHQRHCCAASCLPKTATEPTDSSFQVR